MLAGFSATLRAQESFLDVVGNNKGLTAGVVAAGCALTYFGKKLYGKYSDACDRNELESIEQKVLCDKLYQSQLFFTLPQKLELLERNALADLNNIDWYNPYTICSEGPTLSYIDSVNLPSYSYDLLTIRRLMRTWMNDPQFECEYLRAIRLEPALVQMQAVYQQVEGCVSDYNRFVALYGEIVKVLRKGELAQSAAWFKHGQLFISSYYDSRKYPMLSFLSDLELVSDSLSRDLVRKPFSPDHYFSTLHGQVAAYHVSLIQLINAVKISAEYRAQCAEKEYREELERIKEQEERRKWEHYNHCWQDCSCSYQPQLKAEIHVHEHNTTNVTVVEEKEEKPKKPKRVKIPIVDGDEKQKNKWATAESSFEATEMWSPFS